MPDLLSVAVVEQADRTILTPSGELDLSTTPVLERALASALAPGSRVEVELERLTFVDSSGLRLLIGATERARESDIDLLLHRPSPAVARILELAGLAGRLPIAGAGPQIPTSAPEAGSIDRLTIASANGQADRPQAVRDRAASARC